MLSRDLIWFLSSLRKSWAGPHGSLPRGAALTEGWVFTSSSSKQWLLSVPNAWFITCNISIPGKDSPNGSHQAQSRATKPHLSVSAASSADKLSLPKALHGQYGRNWPCFKTPNFISSWVSVFLSWNSTSQTLTQRCQFTGRQLSEGSSYCKQSKWYCLYITCGGETRCCAAQTLGGKKPPQFAMDYE